MAREAESSVGGDDCRALFVLDLLVDGRLHLMPLRCRRDGRIRLVGASVVLLLIDLDELDVAMIDNISFADLVVERELQGFLLLELVQPSRVLSPCPLSSELLVLEGCTCAATMVILLLLLVLLPDRGDVVVGRAVVRELDASQCFRMRFSVF